MLFSGKLEHTVNELILLFISTVVFIVLIFVSTHIYTLLLLSGALLIFHYVHKATREGDGHEAIPLIGLFGSYFVFFAIFRSWLSLLILPYLINIHLVKKHSAISRLMIFIVPSLLFVMTRIVDVSVIVPGHQVVFQSSWLGLLLLTLNSSFSILVSLIVRKLSDRTDRFRNAISATTVNELSERADKRELMMKQCIIERNIRLEERERISLSIHNAVGHTITTAILSLDASKALWATEPGKAEERLDIARGCVSQSLDLVRQAVRMIDYADETIDSADLAVALVTHIEHFRSITNIRICHNLDNFHFDMPIQRIHAEFLTNTMQEFLSNCRHGNATACAVAFDLDENHMRLAVSDNGTEFSKLAENEKNERLKNGFGLKKIEKHVTRFGGKFKLSFSGGFSVEFMIPVMKEL